MVVKQLRHVSLSSLRFSQPTISAYFKKRKKNENSTPIHTLIDRLVADPEYIHQVRRLKVARVSECLVSLDNRRLACFCVAARFLGIDPRIRIECVLNSKMSQLQQRKLNFFRCSTHRGSYIRLREAIVSPVAGEEQIGTLIRRLKKLKSYHHHPFFPEWPLGQGSLLVWRTSGPLPAPQI